MEIAAVMGGYYWMGFLGGLLLTLYQIHGLLWGVYAEPSWRAMRSHVLKLGVGLMLGSGTLLVEAKANHSSYASMHTIHLNCRLVQGFLGAFLFFYAYLLAATAFEGRQQVFALTLATISLNVAEVFGPFVGAWIFSYWGLQATYYVLAALSILNNVLLLVTYFAFPRDIEEDDETASQPLLAGSRRTSSQLPRTPGTPQTDARSPRTPGVSRPPRPGCVAQCAAGSLPAPAAGDDRLLADSLAHRHCPRCYGQVEFRVDSPPLRQQSRVRRVRGRDPLYDGRVWLHRLVSDPRLGLGAGEQERALDRRGVVALLPRLRGLHHALHLGGGDPPRSPGVRHDLVLEPWGTRPLPFYAGCVWGFPRAHAHRRVPLPGGGAGGALRRAQPRRCERDVEHGLGARGQHRLRRGRRGGHG